MLQKGFSLLEVAIALVVIAVGLFGIMDAEVKVLKQQNVHWTQITYA